MTPETFQTTATAWISAATVVLGLITVFAIYAVGQFAKIKQAADAAKQASATNSARIDEHDKLQGVVTTPTGTVNAVPGQPPYPVTVLSPKVS